MGALPEHRVGDLVHTAHTLVRNFLNVLPDPAWVKDTAGRYIAVNPAYRARYQALFSATEVIGLTDFDLFSREQAEAALAQEREVVRKAGRDRLPGGLHRKSPADRTPAITPALILVIHEMPASRLIVRQLQRAYDLVPTEATMPGSVLRGMGGSP